MYYLFFVFRGVECLYQKYMTLRDAMNAGYFHSQYVGAEEIIIFKNTELIAIIRK